MKNDSYIYDEEYKKLRQNKLDAVNEQNFEKAAHWREKEVDFVQEKYGINIRTQL